MPTIEESVFISCSRDEVFNFISKAENLPIWDVSCVRAEQQGDAPVGLGTRTHGTSKIMGKSFDWTTEVTEFRAPEVVTFTAIDGPLRFTAISRLIESGAGTEMTYVIEAESGLGGVFGRLADPLVERVQDRTVRTNLQTLGDLLSHHPEPTALHREE
jgi:carbon monoxide dehydrogenase subunit G